MSEIKSNGKRDHRPLILLLTDSEMSSRDLMSRCSWVQQTTWHSRVKKFDSSFLPTCSAFRQDALRGLKNAFFGVSDIQLSFNFPNSEPNLPSRSHFHQRPTPRRRPSKKPVIFPLMVDRNKHYQRSFCFPSKNRTPTGLAWRSSGSPWSIGDTSRSDISQKAYISLRSCSSPVSWFIQTMEVLFANAYVVCVG
jgi:hypothetical protein